MAALGAAIRVNQEAIRKRRGRSRGEDVALTKAPSDASFLLQAGASVPSDLPNATALVAGTNITITSGNTINSPTPAAVVINTRRIDTTAPLTGGGDLSADRTLVLTTSPTGQTPVGVTRAINTTAPITGGGDLSADRTLALTTSPTGQTPVGVTRAINTTAPVTGGGDLSADRTIAVSVFVASGASHATGLVPDPGASGGTVKYLREDATFTVPVGTWIKRTIYASPAVAQTHTPDSKCHSMWVRCVGPGGAGGGCTGASSAVGAGGGGGAGGYTEKFVTGVTGTYTYTVGTGGTAGTTGNNPGNNGSAATTFSGTNATLSAGLGNGGGGMAQELFRAHRFREARVGPLPAATSTPVERMVPTGFDSLDPLGSPARALHPCWVEAPLPGRPMAREQLRWRPEPEAVAPALTIMRTR